MKNPGCPEDVYLGGVKIDFYFESYLKHQLKSMVFVNRTVTSSDGKFSVEVRHPKLEGSYTGIMRLSKDGFIDNNVMLNVEISEPDENEDVNVGVLQMMSYSGPPPC